MRVTVFSTKGKKKSVVETTAQTWGELKTQLSSEGIETSGMKSIIGETQLSLESTKAVLPDYDFVLFLSPVKVKSGCDINPETMSYKECKEFIKAEIAGEPDAKDFFGNYTIMSTSQMRTLINNWLDENSEKFVDVKEASVVETIDHVIGVLLGLKDKVIAGTVQEDDTEQLEAMWKQIEANI